MSRPQGQGTAQIDRYYAQPVSVDAFGFGFTSLADFEAKANEYCEQRRQPLEAYVLHLLDGPHQRLFRALDISTDKLAAWFRLVDDIDDEEDLCEIACCLAENGYDLNEVTATYAECVYWHQTAEEYARDFVQHEAVEWLEQGAALAEYIDYHALGQELIRRKILTMISYRLYIVRLNTLDEFIPLCSRV